MNFDNFVKEDKIIDLMKANLVALKYLVLFAIIFSVPFFIIWQNGFSANLFSSNNKLWNLFDNFGVASANRSSSFAFSLHKICNFAL